MKFGLTVFSVLLLTAGEKLAQSDRASTTGTVKDASGAEMSAINRKTRTRAGWCREWQVFRSAARLSWK
jgi:hypothetical protein